MFHIKTIRVVVAATAIILMLLSIVVAYYVSSSRASEFVVERLKIQTHDKLELVQGVAEQLLESKQAGRIEHIIARIASEPDLLLIQVVNSKDVVVASNRLQDVGKYWHQLELKYQKKYIRSIESIKRPIVDIDHKTKILEGYVSICDESGRLLLRQAKCGFVIHRVNFAYHEQLAQRDLFYEAVYFFVGILIAVVMLIFLMDYVVVTPARNIMGVLHRFSGGEQNSRIQVVGNNEIARISKAINDVLDQVVYSRENLETQTERLRAVFETTSDAILMTDKAGVIVNTNPAVEKHLGYDEKELIGKNINAIIPDLSKDFNVEIKPVIGRHRELTALSKDGTEVPVELSVNQMNIDGDVYFTGILRDITDRVKLRESMSRINNILMSSNLNLKKVVKTDSLTGLANRGYFDETLANELRRASRGKYPISLMFFDVDHFKYYNDYYGHQQGDVCLRTISKEIDACFQRAGELVARYGGEEFCVILPNVNEHASVEQAEKLRALVWELNIPHAASKTADRVTLSIGVATFEARSHKLISESEFVKSADEALYEAKANGRNQVCHRVLPG